MLEDRFMSHGRESKEGRKNGQEKRDEGEEEIEIISGIKNRRKE